MTADESMPSWTWEELERELLSLTPCSNRPMVRHLLKVTCQEAGEMTRSELLRELLFTIMAAEGPSCCELSPSKEMRSLN